MEEFARGFPNQHTTHRDTRYICMQTFVSARGPGNEGGRGRIGEGKGGNDRARRRLSAITSVRRRLYAAAAAACIHIYTRAECKARVHAHCKRMRDRMRVHACTHDDSERRRVHATREANRDREKPTSNREIETDSSKGRAFKFSSSNFLFFARIS